MSAVRKSKEVEDRRVRENEEEEASEEKER